MAASKDVVCYGSGFIPAVYGVVSAVAGKCFSTFLEEENRIALPVDADVHQGQIWCYLMKI
jgi:hypothetical protein